MKLKPGVRYEYRWIDCMNESTWTSADDLDTAIQHHLKKVFTNVGYFVKEYKGYFIFTGGTSKRGNTVSSYFDLTIIPKGQVISRKRL